MLRWVAPLGGVNQPTACGFGSLVSAETRPLSVAKHTEHTRLARRLGHDLRRQPRTPAARRARAARGGGGRQGTLCDPSVLSVTGS